MLVIDSPDVASLDVACGLHWGNERSLAGTAGTAHVVNIAVFTTSEFGTAMVHKNDGI